MQSVILKKRVLHFGVLFLLFSQFGEKQKIVLVRLLNKSVMVRVGGGWIPLEEFVLNNDPCKGIIEIEQ